MATTELDSEGTVPAVPSALETLTWSIFDVSWSLCKSTTIKVNSLVN